MSKRAPYVPPIAWERFNAMFIALHGHAHKNQPLDRAMAEEINDALMRLRAIYQAELEASLPNKRTPVADLRAAQLAELLIEWYHVDPATAMEAATGKRIEASARRTVARTLRNRQAKLYGDRYWPTPAEIEAAVERLPNRGKVEK